MRSRPTIWILSSLLLLAGAWLFWPHAKRVAVKKFEPPFAGAFHSSSTAPQIFFPKTVSTNSARTVAAAAKTNQFPYRLSNTTKSIGELVNDRRAILLENALIDTGAKLDFSIPKNLQAQGDPGAYIVQSRGTIGAAFRAMLAAAGAQIVSYIPNNAYLVRSSAGGAGALAANPLAQSVIPYEPYYKVQSPLLAFDQKPLPAGAVLNLGLFADNAAATISIIEKLGGKILSQDSSPFGPIVRVQPPANWTALAQLPGVQIVEPNRSRKLANDLSRVTTGVSPDTTSPITNNYLGLTGRNVTVAVDDSGIDQTHPGFNLTGTAEAPGPMPPPGRVIGDAPQSLFDTNGHGTFVAGEIAGNGSESMTVTNAQGSVTNADFRGKAPLATLYSVGGIDGGNDTNVISDRYFQETAALTNALIANESWGYGGDTFYDLAAASYDAAVRDALSGTTGSQPVLFVFAAGNDGEIARNGGNGNDDGGGGTPDSISSPGTAKNVITVGALEQLRNITNIVTALDGTSNAVWQAGTDSSSQVAGYSSRGNVGIGTEGTFGRYKPDVVAPGTFVISTRSQQWDEQAYYNPTNYYVNDATFQLVDTNALNYYTFPFVVQNNAVGVSIQIQQNALSPVPFPATMPIYVSLNNFPDPTMPPGTTYDFMTATNSVTIPPDGGPTYLQSIINNLGGFNFGVGDATNFSVNYDLVAEMVTTNDLGNYYTVLSNLNETLGPYYRYESGTSMAAADVSGVLALMQDFFTNTLQTTPSPALLKAMLINGARPTGFYNLQVDNPINLEGWGLVNLPDSIPSALTNYLTATTNYSMFFVDQSPTNALATGDSRTYNISLTPGAELVPLRITLAWTDPPGNPAAAIKLVNNLDLIVTNTDDPTTPVVYYGNDIGANQIFNTQENPTNPSPNLDAINNVENVFLPADVGTNFTVVIYGTGVNVNAVTANTNNIVQDFAFVMSSGNGSNTNGFAITSSSASSNPTGDQRITIDASTNASPLLDQFVGASSPLLGTNTVQFGTNSNEQVTVGQTNQWHFYVWTNYCGPNAAFITFLPPTAAIPRGGVFADSDADSTKPEADIDLYVTTDPSLTNLNPVAIANCITNPQVGASSMSGVFYGAALDRGGSKFVVDTNSAAFRVYYIGVKSEDQMGGQYSFLGICSETPFSGLDGNGNESATFYPVDIPDGDATHPGFTNTLALTIYPVVIQRLVVTNVLTQQNAGDLVIALNHSTEANGNGSVVLLNHDSPSEPGTYTEIYDDSGEGDILTPQPSQPSDGPGTLNTFIGQNGMGVWLLHASDNAPGFVGNIQGSLMIQPQQSLLSGVTNTVVPGGWFYDYIDVPDGYTNLSIFATNVSAMIATQPLELFLNVGAEPTLTDFLLEADLTNFPPNLTIDPGNSISYGPPLQPARYWVGVYNPSTSPQQVFVLAALGGGAVAPQQTDFDTNGPVLIDDAVTTNTIFVSATNQIVSVNVGMVVNHPRISDLSFTLVSPTGQRILLMENRGGDTTNGAGDLFFTTNSFAPVMASGGAAPQTNSFNVGETSGSFTISYDMLSLPDEMVVYYGNDPTTFNTNSPDFIHDTGLVSGTNSFTVNFGPGASTFVTIIMNPNGNTNGTTMWTYTAGGIQKNYNYLTFTEDTNLTTIPIKFAVPPYTLLDFGTNYALSDFESATNGDYFAPTIIYDTNGGWNLSTNNQLTDMDSTSQLTNEVSVVTDPATAQAGSSNYLALADGTISRTIPLTIGKKYSLTYWYRGPGIAGWWRGEGDATDSSDPEVNGNNGSLIGRFDFPAGEVGQAFQFEEAGGDFEFAGTNTYVQIRQSPSLNVGTNGFTIEGWINPTNVSHQEPLVEWLSQMPTNGSDTNLVIEAGPFLNPATSHYYYLLRATNWTTSETWATQLGGHLATVDTANEENWIYDTFASYAGTNRGALWIGLNDAINPGKFVYSSGLTDIVYTNWATGQPANCDGNEFYTAIITATNALSGLWVVADNNGLSCTTPATNMAYGVVEVDALQTNGVQLWISVTNTPGTTNSLVSGNGSIINSNGCLYANIMDVSNVSHEVFSAPGLIQSNIYQHVALTYSTNSGIANLYYDGTNVASTNLGVFVPNTGGDVLLGRDMSLDTNNFYGGEMDEMSIYSRALSDAEIQAIYEISNLTTNRNVGKFDPSVTPAEGLAEAGVTFGGMSNVIFGANSTWQEQSFAFTAVTNSLPLQFTGVEPGMLLDSFAISVAPAGNLYYLPEQSLDELVGSSAFGTWTLEIWDNRAGAVSTNAQLLDWQLQFVLQTNVLATPLPLNAQDPATITVPPGQTVFLSVAVPTWATFATNVLVSATAPVDLFFNQANTPTDTVPPDHQFLTNSTGGSFTMDDVTPTVPPLLPGRTYYLGVRNAGAHAVTAVVEVDYDITTLTNGIPFTGLLDTNDSVRYFAFDVSSNAYEATFQLLHLSSNADLVVRKGSPLPTLYSSDYGSFNATNADENIYVLTNSLPVPLSAGRWYLGVFKRDAGTVNYTVLAKELDATNAMIGYDIIDLTNGVPFNFTSGPGAALTNFFRFTVTNTITSTVTNYVGSIRFELYNLSGNGDLTVQSNAPPFAPPFFQSSRQPGLDAELIYVRTNSALTNLAADWYLGVPDNETTNITYTILAVIDTNNVFAAFPGAEGAGAGALGGRGGDVYHVVNLNDDGFGSLRYGITSFIGTGAANTPGTGSTALPDGSVTNVSGARTIVFDVSGTIELLSPLVITNSYLTIAGQTAPGGGITVAGDMTAVQSAHDVVIRYVRFRPGYLTPGIDSAPVDSLKLTNVSDVIADHISASWSTNDILSALNSTNVTVQWSLIADSLTNALHGYGSVLRYGNGMLSFHHNLYADNYNASPRLGDNLQLDFVNNVVYDWGTNAGFSANDILTDPLGFTNELNYECNYLIAGPDSKMTNIAFWGGTMNTWIFQTNNFMDGNKNGILDGADIGWNMFTNQFTEFGMPFALPPVTVDEAFIAYERVQDFVGASMGQRDLFDTNIVGRVRAQSGTLISNAPLSGLVAWWKAEGNANDSVGGNNGTILNGGVSFAAGEVGEAFDFDGSSGIIRVPASPSLDVGQGNGFTVEVWINPANKNFQELCEWNQNSGSGAAPIGVHMEINETAGDGSYWGNIVDTTGNSHNLNSATGLITTNSFQHLAMTYDKTSGAAVLYRNGLVVATANLGLITPQTTFDFFMGDRPAGFFAGNYFNGLMDEVSIYNRALSASEIQAIYNAGTGGKLFLSTTPPPLDTDQDGIPDYWENTLGENPTVWSANADRNLDGYTDLEEYLNWLAAPHALAVTNAPVGVDLDVICGRTGNLSFSLTNAVNGSVYLTNVLGSVTNTGTYSNSIAVFTPANNFPGGFASFDFFVTNNDTVAYFGPVTVSVMDSAVPVLYGSVTGLTNGAATTTGIINPPATNGIVLASNSIAYFSIFAPTNADYATNTLIFASGPLNLLFNQSLLPSGTNATDFELLTNSTGGTNVIATTGSTPSFIPGQVYYLALQNTNSFAVTNYAIEVDFHLSAVTGPVPQLVFGGVKVTGGGVQLQWIASPGAQVQVQWTTNIMPPVVWNTITNPSTTTSNGVSTFKDDGSQSAPLGAMRFYRLLQMSP